MEDGILNGLRVMVIDDSKTIRRTAETLLKKEGCEVVTATDGFEALAKIADHQPQIIFVDIMMPRLDGYQTCALIKNNQLFKGTPVIMLSSKDGLFDKAKGRIVGSDQYLTKPFSKEELLGAIRAHVPDFVPVEQAKRIYDEASGHKEWLLLEGGNHVCNNMPFRYRPAIGDFLAKHLEARPA